MGDKVVSGDILAEIQTARSQPLCAHALLSSLFFLRSCVLFLCIQDKATMEMESMEDGYLARILVADGTEGIPVGKARACMHAHLQVCSHTATVC